MLKYKLQCTGTMNKHRIFNISLIYLINYFHCVFRKEIEIEKDFFQVHLHREVGVSLGGDEILSFQLKM